MNSLRELPETPESSSARKTEAPDATRLSLIKLQAEAEAELRRRYGSSFRAFIDRVWEGYPEYPHIVRMCDVLDAVERGELLRVMFFLPPRYYKTSTASRLFPAYYLFKRPEKHVILTSYADPLAASISRDARRFYLKTYRRLDEEASSVHEWRTEQGGGFVASGIGGPLTGHGFDLGIVDDPIKNREEAFSPVVREMHWQWWKSVFWTRMQKGAAVIYIATRWHTDDLAGRLLNEERTSPEHWHIVNFEALKEEKPIEIPETCTLETDVRVTGQALCPEIATAEQLIHTRSKSEIVFSAMWQQRPVKESGYVWRREWFKPMEDALFNRVVLMDVGTDWDLAYTEDVIENAASAFVRAGVGAADGNIYVDDLDFRWLDFPDLVRWMIDVGEPYYVEAKATGKSAVQMLSKVGLYATEVKVRGGDKVARARIASPLVESGKVFVRASLMRRLLDDEKQGLIQFPSGPNTDLNDAFVQMLNRLWPFTIRRTEQRTAKDIWAEQLEQYALGIPHKKPFDPPATNDWRTDIL